MKMAFALVNFPVSKYIGTKGYIAREQLTLSGRATRKNKLH
jgi:hypothetical protein